MTVEEKKRMEISITLNCFLFSVVFAGKLERETVERTLRYRPAAADAAPVRFVR